MKIVWDEPKRIANIAKHRLDFATLTEAYFANALVLSAKGVISVIFATLGREGISVISMRPASVKEKRLFNAQKS